MESSSHNRDYLCRRRELRSGRIEKPKLSTFVAHNTSWSRKIVAVATVWDQPISVTEDCICAKNRVKSRGMFINFGDRMCLVVNVIEKKPTRMLVRFRIPA